MRWGLGVLLATAASVALAQSAPRSDPGAEAAAAIMQEAPPADGPAALAHVNRARRLAGKDLPRPLELCNGNRSIGRSFQENSRTWLEPTKVFDNLYYVGTLFVGVWIVKTSQGLILIDALGSANDARDRLVPGLRKLGLDPAQIKYVLVTHGHWDHYGGAQYLRDNFGARVGLAEPDWHMMSIMPLDGPMLGNQPPPKKDMVITDGQKLTLGDTTVSLYVTPGHSPGTISAIIPVREGGNIYPLSLLGGTAFPVTLEPNPNGGGLLLNSESVRRLARLSRQAGAVGIINTHISNDGSADRLSALAKRQKGQPNPFVIGADAVRRHYGVFDECLQAAIARRRAAGG